ncbi:PKD domain-containing protein [Fulvivirga sp. M361]|uniref:PKD domain-containing protein n=3 Tax=Fulvivirga sp. M361 TaxID=2594266 RepID=UPI00117BD722|nr:PKD domain-containing protein [Fulvivirga sp. M361]TRX51422.1 PKD domain-containing protein [Fulvivirga sp. M361]
MSITNTVPALCSGSSTSITLNSAVTGSLMRLTGVSGTAGVTGFSSVGLTFVDGDVISDVLANSTSSPVTLTYSFEVSDGSGCDDGVAPFTTAVTVNPNPVLTLTNTTTSLCSGDQTDITLNSPTSNHVITVTGVSYGAVTGGGVLVGDTFVDGDQLQEILENPTNGVVTVSYTFEVTTSDGCPVSPAGQLASVDVQPLPDADTDQASYDLCSGDFTDITLLNPNGVSGTFFNWKVVSVTNITGVTLGQVGTGNTITQQLISADAINSGNVIFEITPGTALCVGMAINRAVNVDPLPVADAGIDAAECDLDYTFAAVISTVGGVGMWSQVSGPGTAGFDNNMLPNATVTVDQFGVYIFEWMENNGGCISRDQIEVTFNQAPVVVSVDDDGTTFCEPGQLSLRGVIGGGATSGTWSLISGGTGTLSSSSLTGNVVTANYIVASNEFGPLVFQLTTGDPDGIAGPCTTDFQQATITINQAATIFAGLDMGVCEDEGDVMLQGSIGGSTSQGTWTGGVGGFNDSNDPNAKYDFQPSEVGSSVVLTFTSDDPDGPGPCTVVSDQVTIDVNPLPVVTFFNLPATSNEAAADIVLSGNQAGGMFAISPGSGLANARIDRGLDNVDFQPSAAVIGESFITYSFTDVNGCMNSDTQNVIVNPVTSIDYNIQNAPSDPDDNPIVCANSGMAVLIGSPQAGTGNPGTEFSSPVSGLVSQDESGNWLFNTTGLGADTINVSYTFVNSFDVSTTLTKQVIVQASPVAAMTVFNSCVEDNIEFFDNSMVSGSSIVSWRWEFDDGTFSNLQNPVHTYSQPGIYEVELTVTSGQTCTSSIIQSIRVGDTPIPDFGWSSICNGDATEFRDNSDPGSIGNIETFTWEFGDGESITGNAGDVIPPGTNGGRTSGIFDDPFHQYEVVGDYNVRLTVQTNDGCTNSVVRTVFILPFNIITPLPQDAYIEDFESGNGGWVATSGVKSMAGGTSVYSDTSWVRSVPNGTVIQSPGNNVWWTGRNGGTYFPDEDSFVNGPCFDIARLTRPMISMDVWVDTQEGFDGAVLQYSTDGGFVWTNLGDLDQGLEWYSSQGLISRPGDNPGNFNEGDKGWSVPTNGWVSARFSLEEIPENQRDFVRLRVAFASDGNNPTESDFNGFAFDNVFIGNKTRTVLLEHFTDNGLQASIDANDRLNTFAQEQLVGASEIDFTTIQYHMDFTGTDPFNLQNPNDPSGRVTFYGVSQPPTTVMDGSQYRGITFELFESDIDRRSLEDPSFIITIDTLNSAEDVLRLDVTLEAQIDLPDPVVLHVAVVEDTLRNGGIVYNNVLKKLIYGAEGQSIETLWTPGTRQKFNAEWNIGVEVFDPDNLFIIAFVQDKVTREVYGATIAKAPSKNERQVTSIDDKIIRNVRELSMYPNPANELLNFKVPQLTSDKYNWKIIDQRGVTILEGTTDFENSDVYQIETRELINGVYYVVIGVEDKTLMYRKLAIMNRK